jgi:3-oxoacyl-[acyl-carrier-protein] synthase III
VSRELGGARLLSVAAERPRRLVTNDELPAALETSDAWIRSRTGIASRHIAGEGESVVDLATGAGGKALAQAGVDPADVDLLLLASCSLPTSVMGAAPQVAARLGTRGGALDVNAACAGFSYALGLAADAVRVGTAQHVLVIGSERMTDIVDWTDRGTCVLFGDGAGAAVVGAVPAADDGISPVLWGTDGTKAELIHIPQGEQALSMDGTAVFRWASAAVADLAREVCAKAGVRPEDLAAFVPHQANLRIIDASVKALGLPPTVVVADDVKYSGNTSGASVPLALSRLLDEGRVRSGDAVLLLAFGAGLAWAGQVVRCP